LRKFKIIKGIAAPLPMINIDTDMIIPKQFLKTIKRSGLGKNLFHELRYDLNGNLRNDFVLNWDPYKKSSILVTGANFGCGSSREHAPWSLLDFGFRSIISTSFADIFYNNCFKNGILPIKLDQSTIDILMNFAEKEKAFTIDLKKQKIFVENEEITKFEVDTFRKKCLLEGLDDIALTLKKIDSINIFEQKVNKNQPWIIK
tara:strand:- start:3 stop:608 length:606 start_codon:yes stop_codon:yes gene_type:complete